jgi:hypothetical protein
MVSRELIFDLVRLEFSQTNCEVAIVHRWTLALPIPHHEAPIALSDHETRERRLVHQAGILGFIHVVQIAGSM